MALTLSQLCVNVENTYQMKLIAGEDGMDNVVRWVHIIEDIEVSHFINGQELIFTTGIAQRGVNWLLPYAEQLQKHGAIGLVINLGPYIEKVPPHLIVWCAEHAFPLFVLPWSVHIIDVTYDFCHRIVQNEKHEHSVASAFRILIFAPEKAEAYEGVLERAGFLQDGRYQVMLLYLQAKDGDISDLEWEQMQFHVYRVLRKSRLPICIFRIEQSICLIGQNIEQEKIKQYVMQIAEILSESGNIYGGISEEQMGYKSISDLYAHAKAAGAVCKVRHRQFLSYTELGVYQILYGVRNRKVLDNFQAQELGVLIEYDKKHHADYVEVLRRYLFSECSIQKVADEMQVHRNTINYKLRHIKKIMQTDLGECDKMRILIAFLIRGMFSDM